VTGVQTCALPIWTGCARRLPAVTLRDLLGEGPDDVRVNGLAYDNRLVKPGTQKKTKPGSTRRLS